MTRAQKIFMSDMITLLEQVQAILSKFDNSVEKINETDIHGALHELELDSLAKDANTKFIYQAESMAFGFSENYSTNSGWGTYYGPMFVLKNEEGQWIEGPSIKLITPEILAYWSERADASKNPLLSLRYADLIWDFSEKVIGKPANHAIAHKVIDATLELIKRKNYKHEVDAVKKIKRALHLSLSLNDPTRINSVKDTMISFEDEIAQDSLPGLWGFSFDELLDNKNIALSNEQKQKIVGDIEARLERTANDAVLDIHAAEIAAIRLAQYYRKWNRIDELRRVLRTYGQAVVKTIEKVEPLAGSAWIERLYEIYSTYGMKEDANQLTNLIRELGEKAAKSLQTISHEFSVSKDEMEKFTDEFTEGELNDALARIAIHYTLNSEEIKQQVIDLSQDAPLHSFIPFTIMDWEGRPVAKIGPLEDDLEGRIVNQMSQNMGVISIFLRATIEKVLLKFKPSTEDIVAYLYQSPLYTEDHKEILSIGIKSYLAGEHIVAAHILIPQIEHAVRQLLKLLGGPIYKPARNGALHLRNLDELLRDQNIISVLGESASNYLRVLLTDQRGWNLRNDISHSTLRPERFSWSMTDRIFHVLSLLALIREKSNNSPEQ